MSNVLIGIIGVILFIGLSLAGALYLGPRFSEAKINADAARVSSNLQQMVDAAHLYRSEGNPTLMEHDEETVLIPTYLKELPENHLRPGWPFKNNKYMLSYQIDNPGGPRGLPANYAVVFLYDGTNESLPRMRKICEALARMSGQGTPSYSGSAGCAPYAGPYSIAFQKL